MLDKRKREQKREKPQESHLGFEKLQGKLIKLSIQKLPQARRD